MLEQNIHKGTFGRIQNFTGFPLTLFAGFATEYSQ